jgi:periplasmic glucans biosynthesis protein
MNRLRRITSSLFSSVYLLVCLLSSLGTTLPTQLAFAQEPTSAAPGSVASGSAAFSFDTVKQKASELSKQAFDEAAQNYNAAVGDITYDDYRKVQSNSSIDLLLSDSPFRLDVLPTGFLFKKYVKLSIIDGSGNTSEVGKLDNLFLAPHLAPEAQKSFQVAGFKVLYPLHDNGRRDEVVVFLGASYFRPLARNQQYGSSARGLAVDTAEPEGEEFPFFKEFWVESPSRPHDPLTFYGLLDSHSVTGAYKFQLYPGAETRLKVSASLYARTGTKKIGIAPLTSMFLFGEGSKNTFEDYRTEVHDADGLLIQNGGGEWIWRPLQNPWQKGVTVTRYLDNNPRGFGLMQRDGQFGNYLDLEARYERRPSLWITPDGDWGEGSVELVEIPTGEETADNIVAYWVPKQTPRVGKETSFSYSVSVPPKDHRQHSLARAVRIRRGDYRAPGVAYHEPSTEKLVMVDFAGGIIDEARTEEDLAASIQTSSGSISDVRIQLNPLEKGARLWFRLKHGDTDADLRLSLLRGKEQVSESIVLLYPKE